MNRTALIVTALLASGSAWAAQPSYSAYADTPPYDEIVSYDVHGGAPVVVSEQPRVSAYHGILDYGEIIADDLNRPGMTAMAGQPGVGDVTARRTTAARTHEHPFEHPELDQSVLSDIGYNF